jgi:hypothetical protein
MTNPKPAPGQTWWFVTCRSCGQPSPVFHDPSDGNDPAGPLAPGTRIELTCPHCEHRTDYAQDDLELGEIESITMLN